MPISLNILTSCLKSSFENSKVDLIDEVGDGYHLALTISSTSFTGKSKVESHRMIYKALSEYMNDIHALSIKIIEA